MSFELQARTEEGARLVAIAETLAGEFATRAAEHDRDASYPFEDVEALRRARYFVAPVPEELGGLGVTSVHDVLVASSRLARGDASVAIGVNMHLISVLALTRRWQVAVGWGQRAALHGLPSRENGHPAGSDIDGCNKLEFESQLSFPGPRLGGACAGTRTWSRAGGC